MIESLDVAIGAIVALTGVFIKNRFDENRLEDARFHDATIRDENRSYQLKQKIYFQAFDSLIDLQMSIVELIRVASRGDDISKVLLLYQSKIVSVGVTLSRIQLVASEQVMREGLKALREVTAKQQEIIQLVKAGKSASDYLPLVPEMHAAGLGVLMAMRGDLDLPIDRRAFEDAFKEHNKIILGQLKP